MGVIATVAAAAGGASGLAAVMQADADPSALTPYVAGGGTAAMTAAIVWIVKKFFSGDVVAKPVAEYQRELGTYLAAMAEREARLQQAVEASHKREDHLRRTLEDSNRALWALNAHLGGEEPRNEAPKRGQRRKP